MIQKIQILERLINSCNRYFKANFRAGEVKNALQYHSGGDDYNPPENAEGIGGFIYDNPAHGTVFAYKDNTERIAAAGEKRIYSTNAAGTEVVATVHLKNGGKIDIYSKDVLKAVITGNIDFITQGDCNISAANLKVAASYTELGTGGKNIARLGDEVTITIDSGSSAGTYKGTITSAGINTSI